MHTSVHLSVASRPTYNEMMLFLGLSYFYRINLSIVNGNVGLFRVIEICELNGEPRLACAFLPTCRFVWGGICTARSLQEQDTPQPPSPPLSLFS